MQPFHAVLATVLAVLNFTTAHLIMDYPVPMGLDSLNNSPLVDAKPGTAESDFPCKQRQGVYDISVMNHFKVADPITLNFTGSASHGGGTCQVAISMDKEPDYQSTWKIIQVFEGGCPTSGDGNDGTHPFSFQIPEGFPNGEATLSWSWYNRVGNREFYMNCAAITVTGGADDGQAYYDSLPDLYVINLPTSDCKSLESSCQKIPHPGKFVQRANDGGKVAQASGPSCAASAAAQTQGAQGYKTTRPSDGATTQAPSISGNNNGQYAPSSSVTTSAPTFSAPPPNYQTLSPSSGAGVSGPSSGGSGSTAAPPPPDSYGSEPGSSSSSSGSSFDSCSSEGEIVCQSPTIFGLCNHGKVAWQDVAAGTQCNEGVVQKTKRGEVEEHEAGMDMMHAKMEAEVEEAFEAGMAMGRQGMHKKTRAHGRGHAKRHVHGIRGRLGRDVWRELKVEEAVEGLE